eukprot:CAMPEP_0201536884 /NCGR_PEP_ID=MMETSP0161_2-20130828/63264_1 /ASSEMBLY_ACC=CAM_ASM_000251 /TAXON_ID=180227 /ORGANISM="Neoparamoeba aestuarina, Strain SoJaBio B1-5/56/2" /LENGTH=49 /DNA_ID= /DNA_START= /DNA_END= /DNA_ORIENTATION=
MSAKHATDEVEGTAVEIIRVQSTIPAEWPPSLQKANDSITPSSFSFSSS